MNFFKNMLKHKLEKHYVFISNSHRTIFKYLIVIYLNTQVLRGYIMERSNLWSVFMTLLVLILMISTIQFFIGNYKFTDIYSAELEGKIDYSVGDGPHAVDLKDLNGDGKNDIVTANYYSDNISVLLNKGNGTYYNDILYEVDQNPRSLCLADLNKDLFIDIITANIGDSDSVTILLNAGNGTFSNRTDYGVSDDPRSVTVVDIKEDSNSDLDIVTANYWSDNIGILKNNGDGTFANPKYYNAGNGPYGIASSDLDGDGDADLFSANFLDDTISVLMNNGDGTFAADVTYNSDDGPRSIFTADLDNMNGDDIIVANRLANNVSVFINKGDGTFFNHVTYKVGANPLSVYCNDLDGDNDIDIVTANNQGNSVSILKNYGNGSFAPKIDKFVGAGPYSVCVEDIDEDSFQDMEIITANNLADSISILITNTAPTISFIEPNGINDVADTQYSITWMDFDPDDNANISLYYWKKELIGGTWELIVTGLNEDDSTNTYKWNITSMPEGEYPLKAEIADPYNSFTNYSLGNLTISHTVSNIKPWLKFIEPDGISDFSHLNYTVTWKDGDPDDNADIQLFYDDDNKNYDGNWLVDIKEDDENYFNWNTTYFTEGEWYVYSKINDSSHEPIYNYSAGPLIINHPSAVPPELKNGTVTPEFGLEDSKFNFSVEYFHLENQLPWVVTLNLTGSSRGIYDMNEFDINDKIYSDGKKYFFEIPLSEGLYSFHFATWDGLFWYETQEIQDIPIVVGSKPYLTNGTVSPIVGLETDVYRYKITYNDLYNKNTEQITVNITGPTSGSFDMIEVNSSDINNSDGKEYQFETSLLIGTYSYHFSATDGKYWVSTKEVMNSPIVTKGEPILKDGSVSPLSGYTGDKFRYEVIYIDPNNDLPSEIWVNITGPSGGDFKMTETYQTDQNCQDGKVYAYEQQLYFGDYSYHFAASDGKYWTHTTEVKGYPKILKIELDQKPSLEEGNVNPKTGYTNDNFNFSVKYSDPENKAPEMIIVRITGSLSGGFNMLEVDPDDQNCVDGKMYFYNVSLQFGIYSYYYAASDGNYWVETNPILNEPIVNNMAPWIKITSPSESNIEIDYELMIEWSALDLDSDANISLYYDTDNKGNDGSLIISGLSEDNTSNSYFWNTSSIPEGNYFIYATINDGINTPYSNYSLVFITIIHPQDNGNTTDNGEPQEPDEDDGSSSRDLIYILLIIGIIIILIMILIISIILKQKRDQKPPVEPVQTEKIEEMEDEMPAEITEPVQNVDDSEVKVDGGDENQPPAQAPKAESVENNNEQDISTK
jgi:hypothetical protein